MPSARADSRKPTAPAPKPWLRIRHVLILGLLIALGREAYPRAQAAWRLHNLATEFANYGLCMAGPTGAAALRDDRARFETLLRRRIVSAEADERPFERCAKSARELTESGAAERAHLASAWEFLEFGGPSPKFRVRDLRVTTELLSRLSEEGWPFAREGYTRLVRPSSHAYEAPHPTKLSEPGAGRGLPAWNTQYRVVRSGKDGTLTLAMGQAANLGVYRSHDGGLNWESVDPSQAAGFSERCVGMDPEKSFTVGFDETGANWLVHSWFSGNRSGTAALTSSDAEIVGASCDESALVSVVKPEGDSQRRAFLCQHAGRCESLSLPPLGQGKPVSGFPIDVARVQGVTVVSVMLRGVVRVTSSRDDGKTWTPYTVAVDMGETAATTPTPQSNLASLLGPKRDAANEQRLWRLLVLDSRVLLYRGAERRRSTYPVMISHDAGASWRTPPHSVAKVAKK